MPAVYGKLLAGQIPVAILELANSHGGHLQTSFGARCDELKEKLRKRTVAANTKIKSPSATKPRRQVRTFCLPRGGLAGMPFGKACLC